MKDLYKSIAKFYTQTPTKRLLLVPAIMRAIPKNQNGGAKSALDIGCGTGDFLKMLETFGYKYYGLDSSKSMLEVAITRYPLHEFRLLSATNFAKYYKGKFDLVLANLVFQILNKQEIYKTLGEIKRALKKKGLVIIGIPHPNFDHYMRYGILEKQGVKADFKGYFKSEQKYVLQYVYSKKSIEFIANHWTLQDYFDLFLKSGFKINSIDECHPIKNKYAAKKKIQQKSLYPTYMVITLQK